MGPITPRVSRIANVGFSSLVKRTSRQERGLIKAIGPQDVQEISDTGGQKHGENVQS